MKNVLIYLDEDLISQIDKQVRNKANRPKLPFPPDTQINKLTKAQQTQYKEWQAAMDKYNQLPYKSRVDAIAKVLHSEFMLVKLDPMFQRKSKEVIQEPAK